MIRLSEYGSGCVCSISDATQEQEEEEVVVVVVIMKAAQRSVIFRISIGSFIQRHSFFFSMTTEHAAKLSRTNIIIQK